MVLHNGPEGPGAAPLARVPGTDAWTRSYRLPAEARFTYAFGPDLPPTPAGDEFAQFRWWLRADPLNRHRVGLHESLCVLPNAPAQASAEPARGVAAGAVHAHRVRSRRLGNERRIYVYTPPGHDAAAAAYPLVVLFDGCDYLSGIPTPTILDNALAAGRLPPTVALFIDPVDRDLELGRDDAFLDVVAEELVPWVQRRYGAGADPSAVVVGGFSLGGVAAVRAAFRHPAVFGNALAQSNAVWRLDDGDDIYERLARQIAAAPRRPIRLLLEDGLLAGPRARFAPFVHLRPVLAAKGYPVTFRTFAGAHHTSSWRGRLGDALVELVGDARPQPPTPPAPSDDLTVEDLGPSLLAAVMRAAALDGPDGAMRAFAERVDAGRDGDEALLDLLGFELLYTARQPRAAAAVLGARVERFPSSAKGHDSLAEALLVAGDRAGAIAGYRRSLALDPRNDNAARLLEQLGAAAERVLT